MLGEPPGHDQSLRALHGEDFALQSYLVEDTHSDCTWFRPMSNFCQCLLRMLIVPCQIRGLVVPEIPKCSAPWPRECAECQITNPDHTLAYQAALLVLANSLFSGASQ